MTKDFYGWLSYDKDVKVMAKKIKATNLKFENIFGIPRGGLIAAVSLSHLLGLPLLYDMSKISAKTIIVDDIIDRGGTVRRLLPKIRTKKPFICAFYYNEESGIKPSIYIRKKKGWVIFPWEIEKTSKYDGTV